MGKISGILSDDESVRQLAELVKMFKSGDFNENGESTVKSSEINNSSNNNNDSQNADDTMPDIQQIMKLASLAGTFSRNDENTGLLLALRPHLSEQKQQKLDKAVKLLKLTAVYSAAKESGLINNIL